MEKRAHSAAEERATEAVVMERKARALLSRLEMPISQHACQGEFLKFVEIKKSGTKLFGSQFDKMTSNAEKSESQRKILEEYVGKLERRLGSSEEKRKVPQRIGILISEPFWMWWPSCRRKMVNSMTRCRWERNRECIPISRLIYYLVFHKTSGS